MLVALSDPFVTSGSLSVSSLAITNIAKNPGTGTAAVITVVFQALRLPVPGLRGESSAIGSPENGAAAREQSAQFLVTEDARASRFEQTVESAEDANGLPAAFSARLPDGTNDGVQARTIATAGDDANAFGAHRSTISRR